MNKNNRFIITFLAIFSLMAVSAVYAFRRGASSTDNRERLLDSVPYLVDYARKGEPWAFEALAECYRHGKGGVEKCLYNAIICYEASGADIEALVREDARHDPSDELVSLFKTMEKLEAGSEVDALSVIDSTPSPKPVWAGFLSEILRCDSAGRKDFIMSRLSVDDVSGDEYFIGSSTLSMMGETPYLSLALEPGTLTPQKIEEMCGKIPSLYDAVGGDMWLRYIGSPETNASCYAPALEYMHRAYRHGFLSRVNMAYIMTYVDSKGVDEGFPFSSDELALLDSICPRNMRESICSPAEVEEEVATE